MRMTKTELNRKLNYCRGQLHGAKVRGNRRAAQYWAIQIFNLSYAHRRRPI